jgi:hypothetical protein
MRADDDPDRPSRTCWTANRVLAAGFRKIQCRWDSGYFAADLAGHSIERGWDFAIGVKT